MILKENRTKAKAPDSTKSKTVKEKKGKAAAVGAADAERAILKAKVAKELAQIKKFRSAFTSESLDVQAWNNMSDEEE